MVSKLLHSLRFDQSDGGVNLDNAQSQKALIILSFSMRFQVV